MIWFEFAIFQEGVGGGGGPFIILFEFYLRPEGIGRIKREGCIYLLSFGLSLTSFQRGLEGDRLHTPDSRIDRDTLK